MLVNGSPTRTIWLDPATPDTVHIIDQRRLPWEFTTEALRSPEDMAIAIRDMHLRGAGLIGAAAGWGVYLAALTAPQRNLTAFHGAVGDAAVALTETRPTAANLRWAVNRMLKAVAAQSRSPEAAIEAARREAQAISDEDAEACRQIGEHGVALIEAIHQQTGKPVNILTHCNAGWLAFVDYGTAIAPIYAAQARGIPLHVWVDETRPRNQGARLTAWELDQQGVPHTVIADNAGGHLMQHGRVDLVLVGSDRTTRQGDVANKIGSYLKALAAQDNGIPFYAALPSSTLDWAMRDGVKSIPIEERSPDEVTHIEGWDGEAIRRLRLTPQGSPAANYAFDVTPARLVTGLITERGICEASEVGLLKLYPEKAKQGPPSRP